MSNHVLTARVCECGYCAGCWRWSNSSELCQSVIAITASVRPPSLEFGQALKHKRKNGMQLFKGAGHSVTGCLGVLFFRVSGDAGMDFFLGRSLV